MRIINKLLPYSTKRRTIVRFFYKLIKDPRLFFQFSFLKELFELKHTVVQLPRFAKISSLQEVKKITFPEYLHPTVSIIIPVWNNWIYTYNSLLKIKENTDNISYEVIVVDDASNDQTPQMLVQIENAKIIRSRKNEGFIRACNKGAKAANGEHLLFLNNDVLVSQGWLAPAVSLLEQDKKVGIVGVKLVFPNGKLQESGGIIWKDASGLNYGRGDNPERFEYNYVKEVDYCSGSCLLIRGKLFKSIGGFDELFIPAYYEDTDLCFSVRTMGYKVLYQPKSQIVHFEGLTAGRDIREGIKKFQVINQKKFFDKWQVVLEKAHFNPGENIFYARDRSRNKKIMLYIDHYVPTYDKDAGSLLTYGLLRIFLEMGFKIIFLPDDMIKVEPYTSELQQMEIEVVYDTNIMTRNYLKKYGTYINTVFLSRPHIAVKYIDDLRKYTKAKVIYFPHDLNFLRLLRKYEIEKSKKIFAMANKMRSIELNLMCKSDATVVLSSAEKDILKDELKQKDVTFIPFLYQQNVRKQDINKFENRKGLLFLGGFMHEPNEDAVLWFVEHIYPLIKAEMANIKFYIAGSNPTPKILQLKSSDIIVTGYLKNITSLFQKAKVFISPLRYGAGVKGKILHSMSFGLPVVTTSIGAEGMNVKNNLHLMIADTPSEFAKQTIKIYTDKGLWMKLSKNSLRYLEENHSLKIVKDKYHALFDSLGVMIKN